MSRLPYDITTDKRTTVTKTIELDGEQLCHLLMTYFDEGDGYAWGVELTDSGGMASGALLTKVVTTYE